MTVKLDTAAIRFDPQHGKPLLAVAEAIVERANRNTQAPIQARHSEVEMTELGVEVIVGAKHAGAVSVEFGTAVRYPSSPILRAARSAGLDV